MSSGFPQVREVCRRIGLTFDPWQVGFNRCLLAKTADGLYAADTAILSICRQAGKTFDIGAVCFALCIADPGTTVVWTAHRFKVARETFVALRAMAKSPLLLPHLEYDDITTAAGNESIPFRNGSRIVFAARERGTIRGFSKVRVLILDEAQILSEAALADLAPTMNQAVNPLVILMGTPPKPHDPSEVLSNLRAEALAGTSSGVLYAEYSADEDADPDDEQQRRRANPSYPLRTPPRAIQRLRKLLTLEDFRREALGIWDAPTVSSRIPADVWASRADPAGRPVGQVSFGLASSEDLSWSAIAVAGSRPDGLRQVEMIDNRPGTAWVPERLTRLVADWVCGPVVVDPSSPAGALLPRLNEAGIPVLEVSGRGFTQACGGLLDAVVEGTLRHHDDPPLNMAVRLARSRPSGEAWVFTQRGSGSDISPLLAATLALHGASVVAPALWVPFRVR